MDGNTKNSLIMAAKFRYKADINPQGKVAKIYGVRGFNQDLALFSGKSVYIEFGKWTKSRSTAQNAYYHACCIPYVIDGLVDNGYERHKLNAEVVHEYLKEKFLKTEIISEKTGDVITVTRSTSELSTTEFMDYIANIQRWAAEFLRMVIPDPEQQSQINF